MTSVINKIHDNASVAGILFDVVAVALLRILEAYRTGRGRVVIRGKTDVELLDSRTKRTAIIIKEIPYQTNKATLVEKIAEHVENKEVPYRSLLIFSPDCITISGQDLTTKSLEGISDIRDESDRTGMRVVIELKRGSEPSIVLNNLYRLTALQSSFNCNMGGCKIKHKPCISYGIAVRIAWQDTVFETMMVR
ncbi:hypothetical protein Ancab_002283 [Ancistrocladus abbreviatus]